MKRVDSIDIRSVVPISAAIFFVLGCLAVGCALALVALAPSHVTSIQLRGPVSLSLSSSANPLVFVAYPFLTAIVGAIGVALLAWLYNVLASRVGPIRLRIED